MLRCPAHPNEELQKKEDAYWCEICGYWEVSELDYLYGKDQWHEKLKV